GAGTHRSRIAGDRFPATAGIDDLAFGMGGTRSRLEDTRESRKVVTQITGSGQERRFSIFVTAITGNLAHPRLRLDEMRLVRVVQHESEQREVVAAMLALAEPRADDHRADRFLLEHPARGNVGDRDAVLDRDGLRRRENTLQHVPATDRVDEALILRLAPVGNLRRLGSVDPSIAEEAAGEHAV